ncbi:MAG: PilZ domain-containing protein [Thermodesulfobacteriota bacterium]
MDHKDRRRYPRYETELEATITASNQKISATMIDMGAGGIGVISEKAISPGTEVLISFHLEGCHTLEGNVVWTLSIYDEGKVHYRMGIDTVCMVLKAS